MTDDEASLRQRFSGVRAMAVATARANPRRMATSIALDVGLGVSGTLCAAIVGVLVDRIHLHQSVAVPGALLVVAVTMLVGVQRVASLTRSRLEEEVSFHVSSDVVALVGALPGIDHHEDPDHLKRIERLTTNNWIIATAVPALISTIEIAVRLGVTIAVLARIDGRLAILPLAAVPMIVATSWAAKIRVAAVNARAEDGRRCDDVFALAAGSALGPDAAPEIRIFGIADELQRLHAHSATIMVRGEREHRLKGQVPVALARVLFAGAFGAAVVLVADRVADGRSSVGQLAIATGMAGQLIGQVLSVGNRLSWLNWTLTAVRDYVWLQAYAAAHPTRVPRLDGQQGLAAPPGVLVDGIRFCGVSFAYQGTEKLVLDAVDLHLAAGEVIAIVGDNGSGKTTLTKLLLGLHRPTSGHIMIDGVDLDDLDLAAWRHRCTAAFQEPMRPEVAAGTVIGLGAPAHLDDAKLIDVAARRSGADAVLAGLARGHDTQLGTDWGGVDLSGGQWQRMAVARSAMVAAPLLLVLDEPAAALDPHAEQVLFDHYTAMADGRRERGAVTVVVSHRLSTVRRADRIVVLDGARIAEVGTHDELVAAGGRYAELFAMQAAGYR